MMESIRFLVVIYNAEIDESISVKSLLETAESLDIRLKLHIWNNGPKKLKTSKVFNDKHQVEITETIENKSLSYIYNEFLSQYCADKYVILDSDTMVNNDFLRDVIETRALLSVPSVKCGDEKYSPTINGIYKEPPFGNDLVLAITSGMVISKELAKIYTKEYGSIFDERYRLYGVDTSFFIRMNKICLSDKISLLSPVEHSLSRLEVETRTVSLFRIKERSNDIGLTLRYYPSRYIITSMIKVLISGYVGRRKKLLSFRCILKVYIRGAHYKDL